MSDKRLTAILHPIVPGDLSPELASLLLFFDEVQMLPDWDFPAEELRALEGVTESTAESFETGKVRIAQEETEHGPAYSWSDDDLLPLARIANQHLFYVSDLANYATCLRPLLDAGIVSTFPVPSKADDPFAAIDLNGLCRRHQTRHNDERITVRWSPSLFSLDAIPFLEKAMHDKNHPDPTDSVVHVSRYFLGLATYVYFVGYALARQVPLVTFYDETYSAMTSVIDSWAAGVQTDPTSAEYLNAFHVFLGAAAILLPGFTPKEPEVILQWREELNRHGELEEFRSFLRSSAVKEKVIGRDEESVRRYVVGTLEPEIRKIERAIKGKWQTLGRHVYESGFTELSKAAIAMVATKYAIGEPLAGLVAASAATMLKAKTLTRSELASSSPNYGQLQYLVKLREKSRTLPHTEPVASNSQSLSTEELLGG